MLRCAVVVSLIIILLCGCQNYEVTTLEDVYHHSNDKVSFQKQKYPFWVVMPGISFNRDAIRDDIVNIWNTALTKTNDESHQPWAWREGLDFHILNPASYSEVDPEEMTSTFENNIGLFQRRELDDYFTKSTMLYFDRIIIHYRENPEGLDVEMVDTVTLLETKRREYFLSMNNPVLTNFVNSKDF